MYNSKMYDKLKNIYVNTFPNTSYETDRKVKYVYETLSNNKNLILAGCGVLLFTNSVRKTNHVNRKIENNEEKEVFIEDLQYNENENVDHESFEYDNSSDVSSSSSSSSSLTEKDISTIISVIEDDEDLSRSTKNIIKLNSAILLLVQQRRMRR